MNHKQFNELNDPREYALNQTVDKLFELKDYYLVGRTNTTRTICNGEKRITFGVVNFYKPNHYYFIIDETKDIHTYKKYTDCIKFYKKLFK